MRLLNHPVLCNYYLTYRCNAACSFCDIWEKPSPYVTLENVKENLAALGRLGVKVVDFTGGEPLLHRELPQFLSLAKQAGFITTVTSNALLYPKMAEALAGKIDMLHFSLDSIVPEKHNASRKVDCFSFVERSIRLARSLGERPDILFTVTNENLHEIPELVERFAEREELLVILNPMFTYNGVGEELDAQSLAELRPWSRHKNVYLNDAFLSLRRAGGNQITHPACKAGDSTVVISPENELILPCYHLGLKRFPIDGKLETLWQDKEVLAARSLAGRHEGCQGCTVNCYMEPSMATELNRWWMQSLRSTIKYSLEKWVW